MPICMDAYLTWERKIAPTLRLREIEREHRSWECEGNIYVAGERRSGETLRTGEPGDLMSSWRSLYVRWKASSLQRLLRPRDWTLSQWYLDTLFLSDPQHRRPPIMASHAPDEAPPPYADAHKFPQGKQTSYPNYPPPAGGSGNSTAGDVGNSGDTVPSAPPSAETTWNTGRPHSNATSHYGPAVGGVPMPGLTVPSENKPPRGPSPIPSPRLRRKDIEAPKAQPDVKAQELSAPPQHLGPAAPNTHAVAQPRPSQPVSGPVDGEPGVGIPVAHPVACPKQSAQVAGAPVQYTLLTNAGPGQPTGTWRMQPTTTGQHAPYPVQNMTHVPGQPQHQAGKIPCSRITIMIVGCMRLAKLASESNRCTV